MRALLDGLKSHGSDLWPIASLQALAGLRVLEAASLRIQDRDLGSGLITIAQTAHHMPKTVASARTIPVCCDVVEALEIATQMQSVIPAGGELFTNRLGNV